MNCPASLRPGISWCLIDDSPVVLDTVADRYMRLSGAAAAALVALHKDDHRIATSDLDRLRDLGIIEAGGSRGVAPTVLDTPPTQIVEPAREWSAISTLQAMIALTRSARAFRSSTLAERIASYQALRATGRSRSGRSLEEICAAFGHSRYFMLSFDNCLVRSFALASTARRHGHDPQILFGVQLCPFAAHCWVEVGRRLLDDQLGQVARFKPILVL